MFNPFLLISAMLLFVFTPAPTPGPVPQEAPAAAPAKNHVKGTSPEAMAKAKKLYFTDCAICHGETGNGKTDLAADMKLNLDDWTDAKALAAKSDEELFDTIRKGKDKMPPEDVARAKNDDIFNMIVYIRSMSKNQPAPAAAPAAPPAN